MKKNYFKRVNELTATRFWINNVTQEEAHRAIEEGAEGCTQNPAYVWKMMQHEDLKPRIRQMAAEYGKKGMNSSEIVINLQRDLVGEIAEIFRPVYEQSHGTKGYVSIQGDPFREDAESIIRTGRFNRQAGDNIMVKIPVTEEGLKAIEVLAAEGVPINATEVMSVRQALDVCEVYARATKNCEKKAPIYYSHITGILDQYLKEIVEEGQLDVRPDILWQAGIAAAKKTWQMTKQRLPEVGFIGGGARGLQHFTEMVGADACITINWKGTADRLIETDPVVIDRFHAPVSPAVIEELTEKVPDFEKAYFAHKIKPEEYEEFGPVVLFRSSFETAWKSAREEVEAVLAE